MCFGSDKNKIINNYFEPNKGTKGPENHSLD
jgi:hypothetical protein